MVTERARWDQPPHNPLEPWPVPLGEWGRPARLAPPAPPAPSPCATAAPSEDFAVHEADHPSPSRQESSSQQDSPSRQEQGRRSPSRSRLRSALVEVALVCGALLAAWLAPLGHTSLAPTPTQGSPQGLGLRLDQAAATLAGEAQMLASEAGPPSATALEGLHDSLEAARKLPPPPAGSEASASWHKALELISAALESEHYSRAVALEVAERRQLQQAAVLLTALARPGSS